MSDIRFNRWLHQSGTGGVSQDSSGNIGIGTTVPTKALDVVGDVKIGDTISIENTSGIITATTFSGVSADFSGNVSIAGTLTYEDVTNIDSVGVVTARSDVHIGAGLSVVGVSTLGNTIVGGATTELIVGGDARITGILTIGTSSLTLDGTNNLITVGSGVTINGNTGIISATGGLNAKLLGTPELAAIDSSITDTAVDIFVYDTRKDSDGGAWRKRTQHTSWYNETLNTATRGSRREFPAVAVIVVTANEIRIYDGDDPDLPMWMVFNSDSDSNMTYQMSTRDFTAVTAVNGWIMCSKQSTTGVTAIVYVQINFIFDSAEHILGANAGQSHYQVYSGSIGERNDAKGYSQIDNSLELVNADTDAWDVASTVLPNAPIDERTGLPTPTVAVATSAGVSVIKDDGTVVDITETTGPNSVREVTFRKSDGKLGFRYSDSAGNSDYLHVGYCPIPSSDKSVNYFYAFSQSTFPGWEDHSYYQGGSDFSDAYPSIMPTGSPGEDGTALIDNNIGTSLGLVRINENPASPANGLGAYITSDYNTGWQHGDIKGAFLSGISTASVTGTELVTNGTFDSDVSGWSVYNSQFGTFTQSNGQATLSDTSDGLSPMAYQSISGFVVGKTYVLKYDTVAAREAYAFMSHTAGINNQNIFIQGYTGSRTGTQSLTFVANATTMVVNFNDGSGTDYDITIDNVSIRIADPDRSVNNKGLQVFGTITKSAVATGAELVAYSGFPGNGATKTNYLEQPYNADLDFGTKFCFMGWIKVNASTGVDQHFFDLTNSAGQNRINIFYEHSGTDFYFNIGGISTGAGSVSFGNWYHLVVTGGDPEGTKIYLNGILKDSSASTFNHTHNADNYLTLGTRYITFGGTAYGLDGSMALIRLSKSIPSAEQIKKIYEDEKVLFQENAACTLHGSSDAVTALAYDDSTNLLYAGTSSGRSDFQGLRRINNTTTAVTTAISASNGLVAEQ